MENIRRIFKYPIARLILHGVIKALIIALAAASLLPATFLVYWRDGPEFDLNFHLLGTADEFFKFASIFIVIASVPVALRTSILIAVNLRSDVIKRRISSKLSHKKGVAIGGVFGCIGLLIFGNGFTDAFIFIVIFVCASLAGGIGAIWMTKDALEIFQSNLT